uniref:Uncharacterized protein n=1 Tax=Rhizophora mucronata TaxID=61149 RepID=A0A2P2L8I9_RHIMU
MLVPCSLRTNASKANNHYQITFV